LVVDSWGHREVTAAAARLAFEHGADIVKAYYTGNVAAFRQVVAGCPVPLLIAGGLKMDTTVVALQIVHDAVRPGAAGVVFGRNIWQSGHTAGMIAALKHIIHHNGSVSEAMQKLSRDSVQIHN
jgi:DhnA family fructose-bisphosphate aldolase class Ia